jgi:hypothetical protein
MSTPLEIRQMIESIRDNQISSPEQEALYVSILTILPQPVKSGKACPECNFMVHNRCHTCPNCKRQLLKRRKRAIPEAAPLQAHECNICGHDASEAECELTCGCRYHTSCIEHLCTFSSRCSEHRDVIIPEIYKKN